MNPEPDPNSKQNTFPGNCYAKLHFTHLKWCRKLLISHQLTLRTPNIDFILTIVTFKISINNVNIKQTMNSNKLYTFNVTIWAASFVTRVSQEDVKCSCPFLIYIYIAVTADKKVYSPILLGWTVYFYYTVFGLSYNELQIVRLNKESVFFCLPFFEVGNAIVFSVVLVTTSQLFRA